MCDGTSFSYSAQARSALLLASSFLSCFLPSFLLDFDSHSFKQSFLHAGAAQTQEQNPTSISS